MTSMLRHVSCSLPSRRRCSLSPLAAHARAHQGSRDRRRRARQPAHRLRPRRRPRRHRRPNQPNAVHDPERSRTCWRSSACSCPTTSTRSCATSRPSPCRRRCRRSRSPGRRIDITVSSIGNAQSLRGGSLADDAAARRRRRDLCASAGQPHRRRFRRRRATTARAYRSTCRARAACRTARPSSGWCRRRSARPSRWS